MVMMQTTQTDARHLIILHLVVALIMAVDFEVNNILFGPEIEIFNTGGRGGGGGGGFNSSDRGKISLEKNDQKLDSFSCR
jgi:hypothetical protein